MTDFPIEPEMTVRDGSRLRSIAEALAFARRMRDQRSFDLWKDTVRRLEAVKREEDAIEAAGALREVLEVEDLLVPGKSREHARARAHNLPLERPFRVRGNPDRIVRSTAEAALLLRELLEQRPNPQWEAVLQELEAARTADDTKRAAAALRQVLESENLLMSDS
jgi:uncharacterized alpha-E superfamily protein